MDKETQVIPTHLDVLFLIRIVFYIWIFFKLFEIVCCRRRRFSVKQRIQRKYIYSHGEMIKNYTPQEVQVMKVTISNTLKNAVQIALTERNNHNFARTNRIKKKVSFQTSSNMYFDPPSASSKNMVKWQNCQTKKQVIENKEADLELQKVQIKIEKEQFPVSEQIQEEKNENDKLLEKQNQQTELL